jgi:hypothetical protein
MLRNARRIVILDKAKLRVRINLCAHVLEAATTSMTARTT